MYLLQIGTMLQFCFLSPQIEIIVNYFTISHILPVTYSVNECWHLVTGSDLFKLPYVCSDDVGF